MKTLSETWFADGYIDFELKKYTLLAYLQQMQQYFNEHKLYPQLADIIFHYNNIVAFRENKKHLQEQFPKRLTGLQIEKLQLLFDHMIADDELMQELEDIIHFSAENMKKAIENGAELYDYVENKLTITPVGLLALDNKEGYFFLCEGSCRNTWVYSYRMNLFMKHEEKYSSISTQFVDVWQRNFTNSYENIKTELLRNRSLAPTPAVYVIETSLAYPLEETLLPVAKRSLVRYINKAS